MPVVFLGHGSPMNIVDDNEYTRSLKLLGQKYPTPQAILVISAHWGTKGLWVTAMEHPPTIYDFGGFPKELYDIKYLAPGAPSLAQVLKQNLDEFDLGLDEGKWGLDHGAWSVLHHMYPLANIPVLQLSLDMSRPMSFHFDLGKKLRFLRERGVLIIGSGNIVHNLREVDWERDAAAYPWCIEFDEWVKKHIEQRDFEPLVNEVLSFDAGKKSIPTTEHYLPLLYILGASEKEDQLVFEYEGYQNASMSMRCLSFGREELG